MGTMEVKLVIVTMFEPDGERAGELARFRDGLQLEPWEVPGLDAGKAWKSNDDVVAVVAGVGPVSTAVNVMTLGFAPHVDFTHAYWLVCGIAGGNPSVCSLGSPVWSEWIVDGDLAHDLHPADHPLPWDTGILPLGSCEPFCKPIADSGYFAGASQVFRLETGLVAWAHDLTAGLALIDPPALAKTRTPFAVFGAGGGVPAVRKGDCLSAARFWHGARHHAWAEKWVEFWTQRHGRFAVSSMEDSGTFGAIAQLGKLRRADPKRALLLRGVSNYTLPPPGHPAHLHLAGELGGKEEVQLPALEAALENTWRAGELTARTLIDGWKRWRNVAPGETTG